MGFLFISLGASMPFLPKSLAQLDEEKKKLQQSNNISGTSNTFDIPGANQSATAPKAEKKSGSWTNLNQYLSANKEQAGMMADKVVGDIDSTAMSADQKLNQIKAATPGQTQALSVQSLKDDYLSKADQLNDDQKTAYNTFKTTGGYSGPSSIYDVSGYTDAESTTKQADQKLKQSQSEGGRQALLKDAYKRPTYTQGQSQLDNLLVQNDAGSKTKFNEVQSKWSNLTSMLEGTTSDVNARIASNQATAQSNKGLFAGAEEAYANEFLNPIKQRATDFNKTIPAKITSVSSDLSDDVLSADTLAQLGLSEGQNLFNTNLSNYLKTDATQASANNMATAQERAKYAALMSLIGKDATDITSDGKAITPITFDKDRFMSDVKAQQDAFNTEAAQTRAGGQGNYLLDPINWIEGNYDSTVTLQDYISGKTPDISYLPKEIQDQIKAEWSSKFDPVLNKFNYNRKVSKG